MKYAIFGSLRKGKILVSRAIWKVIPLDSNDQDCTKSNKGQMIFLIDIVYYLKQLERTMHLQTQRGYIISIEII